MWQVGQRHSCDYLQRASARPDKGGYREGHYFSELFQLRNSVLFGFLSCKYTTNTSNTQEKPLKNDDSYHKNPCNCVVLASFSGHLSVSGNYNMLIYSIFKSRADSDRCFSTFIFYSHALSYVELALNIIPYLRFLLQKALSFPQFVQ